MTNEPTDLFCEGDLYTTLRSYLEKATEQVERIPEQQFLSTDDETLVQHVVSAMEVQPLELHEDARRMEVADTRIDVRGRFNYFTRDPSEPMLVPGTAVTVSIPYTGDPALWKLHPNEYQLSAPHGNVRKPGSDGVGYFDIVVTGTSDTAGEEFKRIVEDTLKQVRWYLSNQKQEIENQNAQLPIKVRQAIAVRRDRLKHRQDVVKILDIPLKTHPGAPDVSPIRVNRRIVKPLPPAPGKKPEHGIRNEDYEHILNVIRHEGRSFEATPATFAVHDEEELRDIILAHLNGHYQGDATGEAFRRSGKTDIRIEVENRAAFVGECKVWRGAKELSEAVGQLLSYLTWRDCKAALVIFNKDVAGFAGVQAKVPEVLASHPNQLRRAEFRESGEWRFVFRAAEDVDRQVTVHVFLFNLYITR